MSYKKFTKDVIFLGITQLFNAISGFIILPIITKVLGAENYGIWTQLTVTLALLSPFVLAGFPYSIVRFLPSEKDKKNIQDIVWSTFAIVFFASLIILLFFIYFATSISLFFGCDKILVQILPIIIIFSCLNQIFLSTLRALQKIGLYCFFTILGSLGESLLIILSIFLTWKLLGAIFAVLIIQIIIFTLIGTLIIKKIGIKLPKFYRIKEYLSFSLPTLLSDASYWIVQASDKYFIGFFLGTLFVGYYAPAYILGCSLILFASPLNLALPAPLSKYYDENEIDKVKNYLKYSLKYFLAIIIPATFGISVLSKPLLSIISTPEIANNSYFIVPFVATSMILCGCYDALAQIINLKKKTKITGIIWLLAALINVALNFIFVPLFGILGAAITTLLAYFFALISTWIYAFQKLNFKFQIDWKFIFKSTIVSALMYLIIFILNPIGLWKTLSAIILGTGIYFIFIFLFKGFEKKELDFLKEFLKFSSK